MAGSRMSAARQMESRQACLLDKLVGSGKYRLRHGQAEGLGRLEDDHQLELGRLLERQRGWIRAFENKIDVTRCTAHHVRPID